MKTLLLPGLICGSEIWAHQETGLFETVAVPGYGVLDDFVSMAEHVLTDAPEEFYLAGHSMGARVALEVYRLAPGRVKKLALLDTGVQGVQEGEAEKRHVLIELGRTEGFDALLEKWLLPMVAPSFQQDQALMSRLRNMCRSKGLEVFEAQVKALLNRPCLDGFLETIEVPTLVATGTLDLWSPPAQHREMAARIQDAKLVIFEGAGHMAPAETPEMVTSALRAWQEQ